MKWIAVQTNELDDYHWLQMTWEQRGRLDALKKLAGRLDDCGALTQNGRPLKIVELATILRDDPEKLSEAIKVYKRAGIIVENGRGFEFVRWAQEQKIYIDKNRKKPAETGGERLDDGGERRMTAATALTPHHTTLPNTTPPDTTPHHTTAPSAAADGSLAGGDPAELNGQDEKLRPDQQERVGRVMPILLAASVGKKKAFEASVYVATRINKSEYIEHVMAALASCYDDPEVKSPGIVAVTRILRNKVPPEYKLAKSWKSIPPTVLEAAGISNLNEYMVSEFVA